MSNIIRLSVVVLLVTFATVVLSKLQLPFYQVVRLSSLTLHNRCDCSIPIYQSTNSIARRGKLC